MSSTSLIQGASRNRSTAIEGRDPATPSELSKEFVRTTLHFLLSDAAVLLGSLQQLLRQRRRRNVPTAHRVLTGPQRREVAEMTRFGRCAQRSDRGARDGKGRRRIAHRSKLTHQAVHDAASGTAGKEIRHGGDLCGVAAE